MGVAARPKTGDRHFSGRGRSYRVLESIPPFPPSSLSFHFLKQGSTWASKLVRLGVCEDTMPSLKPTPPPSNASSLGLELTVLGRAPATLLRRAGELGLDRKVLERAAGLVEADLADPDVRVSKAKVLTLWREISERVGDPLFGSGWGPPSAPASWAWSGMSWPRVKILGMPCSACPATGASWQMISNALYNWER